MPDYLRSRAVADRQIRKWGATALLRKSGSADVDCWAMEVQLSYNDRKALKQLSNRVFLISAVDLEVEITREHALVWGGKTLRQDVPPITLAPGGVIVHWELQVTG